MNGERIVLVTGAAGFWGGRLAARLASDPSYHVIGLDTRPIIAEIIGLDFVEVDVRNPRLAEFFHSENVDTVCHLEFEEESGRPEAAFEQRPEKASKVLEACAEAGVKQVVVKSSTVVYGARADNPAFLTEDKPLRGSTRRRYIRYLMEIEALCNNFQRHWPQTAITVLRFANIIGPSANTPLTRFLRQRSPHILLGFDPIMQLIHEEDTVEALAQVVKNSTAGVFNVAADGAMPLSRMLRLVRKIPAQLFHPLAYWRSRGPLSGRLAQPARDPFEWDYLRYPWVADLTKMREELDFIPLHLPIEALREFAGCLDTQKGREPQVPSAYDEQRLQDIMEYRRQARERQVQAGREEIVR